MGSHLLCEEVCENKGNDSSSMQGAFLSSKEVSRKKDLDRETQVKGKGCGEEGREGKN